MEKKNNTGLWIIIIILLIVVGGLSWYAGTKYANKEDKVEQKEKNKKETTKENEKGEKDEKEVPPDKKMVYLDTYVKGKKGLVAFYEDASIELISEKVLIDRYSIDGNTIYYTNPEGVLFSFDLTKTNEEHKKYDVVLQNSNFFSVVGDKMYSFVPVPSEKNLHFAITYDLKTGEEKKEEIKLNAVHVNGVTSGTKFLIDDNYNINIPTYSYLYDFATNTLTKYGSYNNVVENRKNYVLFEKNYKEYCVYDKTNVKELVCVAGDKNDKRVYKTLPTSHKGKLYILNGNKIKECSTSTDCIDYYTLTEEEAKAPSLGMRFIGDNLLLTVGTNEKCEEGCSYDYKTYNLSKDHKEMDYQLEITGYNQGLFLE